MDDWLTAAAALDVPLNLAQAKLVKSDVVETLFNLKRQATIIALGNSWACDDESVNGMTRIMTVYNSSAVIASINSTLVTLVDNINVEFNDLAIDVYGVLSTYAADLDSHLDSATVSGNAPSEGGAITDGTISVTDTSPGGVTAQACGYVSVAPADLVGWTPIGSSIPITLTYQQLASLISSIENRRAVYNGIRLAYKAQIASLTTVAAVISFDPTSGW